MEKKKYRVRRWNVIDIKKIFFFSIFLVSLIFYGLISFQEPTQVKTPASQMAEQDTTKTPKTIPDSSVQKSWFERNPALVGLIGAVIGVIATLIGVYVSRPTPKKEARKARSVEAVQLKTKQQFEEELQKIARDETELRYLRGIESEHSKINLYGFQSTANVRVRTLDVFVSLRLTHRWRDSVSRMREEIEDGNHLTPEAVLQRAFRKKRSLLIVGDPGSGKTTMLKYYAICCLDQSGREKIGLEKPLIPIVLPLRKVDPNQPFREALSAWATKKGYAVDPKLFDRWLEKRGALVMLDGLDEISDKETRIQVCDWIDNACNAYRNSRFVVTSRFTGYRIAEGVELQSDHLRADVLDLDREQQKIFLKKWFRAAYAEDSEASDSQNSFYGQDIEGQAEQIADHIFQYLDSDENASLRQLAGTPVLLQIMAILWKEYGSLASGRASLYGRCTDYLLDRDDKLHRIKPLLPADQAKLVLRPVALWMQEKLKSDDVAAAELEKRITPHLEEVKAGVKASDFIQNLINRAGILEEFGDDSYIFRHKSFREFLAAEQLAEEVQRKPKRVRVLVDNFSHGWWRETLLFALSLTKPVIFTDFMERFLPHKYNAAGFPPLLEQIIKEAPKKSVDPFENFILNSSKAWQTRHNALQCLRYMRSERAEKLVKRVWEQEKHERLKDLAEDILIQWEVLKPAVEEIKEFPEIGELRKSWRNPLELNTEYLLIPGGKFTYSVTKKETEVPPLYFAKYLVTNKLYRRFIDYLGGRSQYEQMSHVPNLPLKVFAEKLLKKVATIEHSKGYLGNEPNRWAEKLRSRSDDEKRFNGDDQPVVDVTWYAAAAYCCWLTELHRIFAAQSGDAEKHIVFRLPTEQEWEWAASGGKRAYPWGKEKPDKTRANYAEEVGQTTPVGAYPVGATPEGLMDMAGNVWEWMENPYRDVPGARALRGGSWVDDPDILRCDARLGNDPVDRYDLNGFRLVCVQS